MEIKPNRLIFDKAPGANAASAQDKSAFAQDKTFLCPETFFGLKS
jgi:hypothetical protein